MCLAGMGCCLATSIVISLSFYCKEDAKWALLSQWYLFAPHLSGARLCDSLDHSHLRQKWPSNKSVDLAWCCSKQFWGVAGRRFETADCGVDVAPSHSWCSRLGLGGGLISPRATQLSISTSPHSSTQAETREGAGQQKGKCFQLRLRNLSPHSASGGRNLSPVLLLAQGLAKGTVRGDSCTVTAGLWLSEPPRSKAPRCSGGYAENLSRGFAHPYNNWGSVMKCLLIIHLTCFEAVWACIVTSGQNYFG